MFLWILNRVHECERRATCNLAVLAMLLSLCGCMQPEPVCFPAVIHPVEALQSAEQKPDDAQAADAPVSADEAVQPEDVAAPEPEEPAYLDDRQQVRLLDGDIYRTMSMREYLRGVLAAEMPQSFSDAAMQAQAAASRTFALRKLSAGQTLCSNPSCCQAYRSCTPEEAPRAEAAIRATDGMVLTYGGALIEATFFSCSGGMTEAAVEVWGSDVPYLQAVESPNEEDAPRYCDETSLPRAEFVRILQTENPAITGAEPLLGTITRTQGGGVATATLCGQVFEGTTLRRLFGLRSTDLTIRDEGERIVLTTRGFGHRVGMSQYGARAMAEAGDGFETILLHYYQGAALYRLELSE